MSLCHLLNRLNPDNCAVRISNITGRAIYSEIIVKIKRITQLIILRKNIRNTISNQIPILCLNPDRYKVYFR